MTLSVNAALSVVCKESPTADLTVGELVRKISKSFSLLNGTGAGLANKLYADSGSQVESVNTDLDLAGSLAGLYGTVVFTAVKLICITAGAANPGVLTLGNGSNPYPGFNGAGTHTTIIEPGGGHLIWTPSAAGRAVTASSADILRIASAASAGTYTYDLIIVGIG